MTEASVPCQAPQTQDRGHRRTQTSGWETPKHARPREAVCPQAKTWETANPYEALNTHPTEPGWQEPIREDQDRIPLPSREATETNQEASHLQQGRATTQGG